MATAPVYPMRGRENRGGQGIGGSDLSGQASSDDKVQRYRRQCAEDERAFAERGVGRRVVARIPMGLRAVEFASLHARQFYWTMRRVLDWRRERRWAEMADRSYLEPIPAQPAQARPRILVDVTMSARSPTATGIQRVVRAFAKEGAQTGSACPVVLEKGLVYEAYAPAGALMPLAIEEGDILFLLDASWGLIDEILPVIAAIKRHRGRVVAFFFDMIPILYPDTCWSGIVGPFRRWFDTIIPLADAIFTNAEATADDIRGLTAAVPHGCNLPIGVFPLGCEMTVATDRPPSPAIREACGSSDVFLSIGTIEPRKGHPIALAAFEALWSGGSPARYVMIGRTGWNMAHFEWRVTRHPEFGRRLFWLKNADDVDLAYAYAQARAVIVPSIAEGYGMPIIEAAAFGTDVILSDIGVFREVGHYARATYFAVANADDLAAKIMQIAGAPQSAASTTEAAIEVPTWSDVVAQATDMLRAPRLCAGDGRILVSSQSVPATRGAT